MSDSDESLTWEDRLELAAVAQQNNQQPKEFTNNEAGLLKRARELDLDAIAGFKLPFIETMTITASKPIELGENDVHDDLKREMAFYSQALEAVKIGKQQILDAGLPFSRPSDYFAEMVKSDDHMTKIRKKMLEEQQSIKHSEEAKKQREMKKFGKKVQHQKLLERQEAKKAALDKVNELKKKRKNNPGADDDDEFDIALEDTKSFERSHKKQKTNTKRVQKNEKYGFGGKKRGLKKNSADSTNEFSFSGRKNKSTKGFVSGNSSEYSKKKKPAAKKRPGKSKRMNAKGRA